MEGALIGVCNPLLDISAEVPIELLQKYELLPNNAILADESKHLPLYAELVAEHTIQYIAGGSGQNTMRAAQWLLKDHPNSTIFIGSIGKDENGERLKGVATSEGVKVLYHEDQVTPTGICAVLITGRDRSMVARLAAANNYKKEHYDSQQVQEAIQKAKVFYGTGYFLTVSSETLVSLGQYAAKTNKPFLTSLSAPFIVDFFWDQLASVLPYADVVFGNETEYGTLGKKLNWGTDLKEIAKKLAEYPKENKLRHRIVIVTQGPDPTIVVHNGELFEYKTLKVDNIVDTNGAGDSFVGGFLAGFVQDKPLSECVEAGNYCASVTLQTSGTSFKGRDSTFQFSK
jgi:adenosine kinase